MTSPPDPLAPAVPLDTMVAEGLIARDHGPTPTTALGDPAAAATPPTAALATAVAASTNNQYATAPVMLPAVDSVDGHQVPMNMDVDPVTLSGVDSDGFTRVRSKKRARVDAPGDRLKRTEVRMAPHPGTTLGIAAPLALRPPTGTGGTATAGQRAGRLSTAPLHLAGRTLALRSDGVAYRPSPLLRLRMSPLEEGQIPEMSPMRSSAALGFGTSDGSEFAPPIAGCTATRMTSKGPMVRETRPVAQALPPQRNATPGPSVHRPPAAQLSGTRELAANIAPPSPLSPSMRAPLLDVIQEDDQLNVPLLPEVLGDLPPLLRLQTISFLRALPTSVSDNLIGAVDNGMVPGPVFAPDYPAGFWPEAVDWVQHFPWLWEDATGDPNVLGDRARSRVVGNGVDERLAPHQGINHGMQPLGAQNANAVFIAPQVAGVPPAPAPIPAPPMDVQNFIVLPSAVQNGGRLTNRPFPMPRAHLLGAAQIQPPFDIEQTPKPGEGFPRIRLCDPEALYAGWDVDRVRHVASLDPLTTVIASVHAPQPIKAGDGWPLVQAVETFVESICGATGIFVVPIELQNPVPRYDPDDITTWPPTTFPIWDLPVPAARAFVAQQTFSVKGFTVHFFYPELRFEDFLGRIEGFTKNDVVAITDFIRRRFSSDEVRAIIRKYVARNPHRNVDPLNVAVQKIIDSLRVEIEALPPSKQPNALVYIDTPADTIIGDRSWRRDLRVVQWKSLSYGTGVLVYLPPCRGCGSVKHRTETCPLPDLEGWNGPSHAEVARLTGARITGRGRGSFAMGRGRGRAPPRG